ncbi:Charged multivesicular body protein 6 [Halotydeus destructor]|nr:Charged multivesicular body protein 6 [Halotydeus destructor]
MGAIFGKSKPPKKALVTEQDRAVLQLKQQRDKIKQFQKRITQQLEKEKEIARELLKNGQKEKALSILKKKKRMETTLDRAAGQLENLEKMTQDIEFAQIEVEVVKGLQTGNEALKQLHALMSIDSIEAILDETREGVEKQREIDELLGNTFTAEDESDLLAELEELTEGLAEEVKLPEVPVEEPEADEEEQETEIVREKVKPKKEKREALLAS